MPSPETKSWTGTRVTEQKCSGIKISLKPHIYSFVLQSVPECSACEVQTVLVVQLLGICDVIHVSSFQQKTLSYFVEATLQNFECFLKH